MRKIPRPSLSTKEILLTSIANYQDKDLIDRLKSAERELTEWAEIFEGNIINNTVHTINKDLCIPQNVSSNEMVNIYDDKFAKKTGPGRELYNQIKNSAKNNMCPFCGYRPVDSLDHYLPKRKFPALAISPINLIPACLGCNKKKGEGAPTTAAEEFLHPYFDDIDDDFWLYSEVLESVPITVRYRVMPPETWSEIKKERVKNHFKKFHLGQLYSSYVSEELSEKIYILKIIFESGGSKAVKEDINKSLDSFRYNHKNSWKTALFKALADSEWFCEEALSHSIEELLM
ncbi:HNH endonuclease [Exiguobacterium sp. RIT341]|uniref:HNH endonuclease n=1 Tax=Exiguobacterium sp. RIT341 TaxID=1470592 RepID=UPI00044782AB|nr:hypothetical protein [Exiguobacterium sp. RIT341]EZP61085.1 hypothetical protein BW42_00756 [Exiguobacterium sp. RIT341]